MGHVQCFVIVLMLSAQSVFTFPSGSMKDNKCVTMCPPGTYKKSCTECVPCSPGSYTTDWNAEDSCHICYLDCRTVYNLKVVQNCTNTSDVKCSCEDGFECSEWVTFSTHCKLCRAIQTTTGTTISDQDKHTPSSASSGHSSTSTEPCRFPKCGSKTVPAGENGTNLKTDKMSIQLAAILCPVVVMGFVALMVLFFVRRPGDESCFKQAIALLICNERGRDASHKSKESTQRSQFPRESFSAKQPPPISAANLGPVHVHNPGTVIFSLLSHFTGQVGTTIEAGKTTERTRDEEEEEEEEEERGCPVFHPTSSPSIHLSEEERSGEDDSIFFPSQEQGKDYHVSKEEVL